VLPVNARPDEPTPADPVAMAPAFEEVPGIDVVDGELVPRTHPA
jgi:hypothetical protein